MTDSKITAASLAPYFTQKPKDGLGSEDSDKKTSSLIEGIARGIAHDEVLIANVRNLFEVARQHRRPMISQWFANYRILHNKMWHPDRPTWMAAAAVPEIFPVCDSIVGWATDQRVEYEAAASAVPNSPHFTSMEQIAQDLQTLLNSSYHVNKEEFEVSKILWDGLIYGTGIGKTMWQSHLAGGLGDATMRRVDPFTFFPDPNARSMEDAEFFIEVKRISKNELRRRFPGSGKSAEESGSEDIEEAPTQLSQDGSRAPRVNMGGIGNSTARWSSSRNIGTRNMADDFEDVTIFETYLREHDIITVPWIDDTGKQQTRKSVVEKWRVVVTCNDQILMNKRTDELWSHGGHPYDRFAAVDLGEFWGISMVGLLSNPQKVINRVLTAMQQNIELVGNPVLAEPSSSGTQRTRTVNRPGQRLEHTPGQAPSWLNPPQIHAAMPQMLNYMLQRLEAISGLTAINKGGSPSGRPSQGVVDSMQESSFVRIRKMLRNLESFLRGVGIKKAGLITDNYDQPRVVAVLGDAGEKTYKMLKARHFQVATRSGAIPFEYVIRVSAGSQAHTSRQMQEEKAVQLFTLGAIDPPALLEMVRFPNWQAVAQRVQEAQAAAAEAEAVGPGKRERARA